MKIFILTFGLLIAGVNCALASEITGRISTNPNDLINSTSTVNTNNVSNSTSMQTNDNQPKSSGGSLILPTAKPIVLENKEINEVKKEPVKKEENIKVLGLNYFPDGTLVRDESKRIFLVQGQKKKHIQSLKELFKYKGRKIYNVSEDEMAKYKLIDGSLIREKNTFKVYALIKGKKKHIINLEELRAHYFGLEIFNITSQEMSLY